jgi:hypothetical protein
VAGLLLLAHSHCSLQEELLPWRPLLDLPLTPHQCLSLVASSSAPASGYTATSS